MRSQRASREVREAESARADLARKLQVAEEEKQIALNHRRADSQAKSALQKEVKKHKPPTLKGKAHELPRVQPKSDVLDDGVLVDTRYALSSFT